MGYAHLCASRPRVILYFCSARRERPLRSDVEYRLFPARAHRKIGWTGAPIRKGGERLLHDPVFDRVIADRADDPTWAEPSYSSLKPAPEDRLL